MTAPRPIVSSIVPLRRIATSNASPHRPSLRFGTALSPRYCAGQLPVLSKRPTIPYRRPRSAACCATYGRRSSPHTRLRSTDSVRGSPLDSAYSSSRQVPSSGDVQARFARRYAAVRQRHNFSPCNGLSFGARLAPTPNDASLDPLLPASFAVSLAPTAVTDRRRHQVSISSLPTFVA